MGPQCRGTFGRSEVERFFFERTNKRSHPSIVPLSSTGDCAVDNSSGTAMRVQVWGDSIREYGACEPVSSSMALHSDPKHSR